MTIYIAGPGCSIRPKMKDQPAKVLRAAAHLAANRAAALRATSRPKHPC